MTVAKRKRGRPPGTYGPRQADLLPPQMPDAFAGDGKRPRGLRYPWDDWLSKGRFTLVRGVHYNCATHGMHQTAINAARKRGLKISVRMTDGTITIAVVGTSDAGEG